MIELKSDKKESDFEKATNFYNEIKELILSKSNNEHFHYEKKQHHLYEEADSPNVSKDYYNENGSVEFENNNNEIIGIAIERWHPHQHNGFSGLNGRPCLSAIIYIKKDDEKQVLWNLKVKSGTMYYKAEVTSTEIPKDYLIEKIKIDAEKYIEVENEKVQEDIQKPILLEELNNSASKLTTATHEKEAISLERDAKIKMVTEEIILYYSSLLEPIHEKINIAQTEMNNYADLISKYSTFEDELIGNALAQLVSVIEGKEFLYEQATCIFKKRVHGPIDSWDVEEKRIAKIIVSSEYAESTYWGFDQYVNPIYKLANNGEAILLLERGYYRSDDNKIKFYISENGDITLNVKLDNFDYINDFIEKVIQFRFQNNLEEFTEEDMNICIQNFINEYGEKTIKNNDLATKEKALKLTL